MRYSVNVYASVEIDKLEIENRMMEMKCSEGQARLSIALDAFHPAESVQVRELQFLEEGKAKNLCPTCLGDMDKGGAFCTECSDRNNV